MVECKDAPKGQCSQLLNAALPSDDPRHPSLGFWRVSAVSAMDRTRCDHLQVCNVTRQQVDTPVPLKLLVDHRKAMADKAAPF